MTIILQNIAQLKALFEKQWESIWATATSSFISAATNQHPQDDVGILLGKSTIDTNTYGKVHAGAAAITAPTTRSPAES